LSERSSGSVFLSADKPSLFSSLFHHQSHEPDVIHRSVIGQKLADAMPPRSTSPVAGEKSHSLPVEHTQPMEMVRPLSANVVFGTPAIMRRVGTEHLSSLSTLHLHSTLTQREMTIDTCGKIGN